MNADMPRIEKALVSGMVGGIRQGKRFSGILLLSLLISVQSCSGYDGREGPCFTGERIGRNRRRWTRGSDDGGDAVVGSRDKGTGGAVIGNVADMSTEVMDRRNTTALRSRRPQTPRLNCSSSAQRVSLYVCASSCGWRHEQPVSHDLIAFGLSVVQAPPLQRSAWVMQRRESQLFHGHASLRSHDHHLCCSFPDAPLPYPPFFANFQPVPSAKRSSHHEQPSPEPAEAQGEETTGQGVVAVS